MISIWFFIGIALLVDGVLIFSAGMYELWHPPVHPVVLFSLHAPIWWGALLLIFGLSYTIGFRPRQSVNKRRK